MQPYKYYVVLSVLIASVAILTVETFRTKTNPYADAQNWPWGDQFLDQMTTLIVPGSSGGPVFNAENDKLVGIAVGWAGMPGISFFVPLRTLVPFSHQTGFDWAVYGGWCPSDAELRAVALKYVPKPSLIRDFTVD